MHKPHFSHFLLAVALVTMAQTLCFAEAQLRGGREAHRQGPHREWHGDIRRFHEYDMPRWRSGHWYHGRHDGQFAWWWIVGGAWYFYPRPNYPYPDPYLPPVMVIPPPSQAVPATQYWYFCPNPEGYYPYVAKCLTEWQKVPATIPADAPR